MSSAKSLYSVTEHFFGVTSQSELLSKGPLQQSELVKGLYIYSRNELVSDLRGAEPHSSLCGILFLTSYKLPWKPRSFRFSAHTRGATDGEAARLRGNSLPVEADTSRAPAKEFPRQGPTTEMTSST